MGIEDIKEVDVAVAEEADVSWEEKDFVDEDSEVEGVEEAGDVESFSIGDTMLARGGVVEKWGSKNLEEELEIEEFDRAFDDDVFEEEEEEGIGFSYDAVGGSSGVGDLYGAVSSGAGLYGASSGSNLYGVTSASGDLYEGGKSDSVSLYSAGGNSGNESSLYNAVGIGGKKNDMGATYKIEGPKKKSGSGRRSGKSGLEGGVARPAVRRSKGVSII